MSVTATAGHPQYADQGLIPEFFANDFNIEYRNTLLLPRITTGKFYEQALSVGDKVTVASVPEIESHDYTKGMTLDVDTPESTPVEMTVNRAKYFNFLVDKVDMKQSHLEIGPKYVNRAIYELQRAIERQFFASIYTQAHASNSGAAAGADSGSYNLGAAGSPLALTTNNVLEFLTAIRAVLGEQDAADEKKLWVVIPEWLRYRMINSDLKNVMVTGDPKSVMRTGRLGMLDGLNIYASRNLKTSTADQSTGTYVMAGNMDAISHVAQMSPEDTEEIKSETTFGTKFRSLTVYDWNVRKPEGLVAAYVYAG